MNQLISNIILILEEMNNLSCENQLINELLNVDGIQMVEPNFIMSLVLITYLAAVIKPSTIVEVIESLGYRVKSCLDETKSRSRYTHCS